MVSPKGETFRLKRTFTGKLVLQVEEVRGHVASINGSGHYDEWQSKRWRNAKLSDLPQQHIPLA